MENDSGKPMENDSGMRYPLIIDWSIIDKIALEIKEEEKIRKRNDQIWSATVAIAYGE